MSGPGFDPSNREDWDENDWERFLRRADARTAKYQELFETLIHHPKRDILIAQEMGWEQDVMECGGDPLYCPDCAKRDYCEAYEMSRLMMEPQAIEDDPDAADLIASFEQIRDIDAYRESHDFAVRLEECLAKSNPEWIEDEDARGMVFSAQMVPAQIAGGHGIGYGRDSLCGNIANCKRALDSLRTCLEQFHHLRDRGVLASQDAALIEEAAQCVTQEIGRWVENLRARIWWQ
jgi:hypothetical protein